MGAQEIYESGKGFTAENQSLEAIIYEMQQLNSNLILPNTSTLQGNQQRYFFLPPSARAYQRKFLRYFERQTCRERTLVARA
jgi:hypothetical protein